MVTAEVKRKSKRIAHRAHSDKVCHNFIHGDADYFYSYDACKLWCWGNFLFVGKRNSEYFKRIEKLDIITNNWELYYGNVLGIIDRKTKRIVINEAYNLSAITLRYAVPEGWTIYKVNEVFIKTPNVFDKTNKEYFCEIVLKNAVSEYYNRYYKFIINVITGKSRCIWMDSKEFDKANCNLVNLVNSIKCKRTKAYNKVLLINDDEYKGSITPKMVYENTVLNASDKIIIDKRYFWTNNCLSARRIFKNGIKFSEVLKYWNKTINTKEELNVFNKRYGVIDKDFDYCFPITWKDYVVNATKNIKNYIRKCNREAIELSKKSYQVASEKHKTELEQYIENWRNFIDNDYKTIDYLYYIYDTKEDQMCGKPFNVTFNSFCFDTIQLRYTKDFNIETNEQKFIFIDDAIKMWHFFDTIIKLTDVSNGEDFYKQFSKDEIKCDKYPLVSIKYCDKIGRHAVPYGYKEWAITIGCNIIWKDDILKFIHYYHLEDKFGIAPINKDNENKEVKFKIKIK